MSLITRGINWLYRFALCSSVLGIKNAFSIFILSRFTEGFLRIVLPGRIHFYFRGKLDKGVVSHFYKEGSFVEDTDQIKALRILDCGANIGDETARFLVHYPYAEIVAVEVERSNFEVLQKNFAGQKNVTLINGAIYPVETNLKIKPGTSMEDFRVIETADDSNCPPVYSIPKIMTQMGWDEIDILKLDIEGAEYQLFTKEYQAWIEKINTFIFELPDNDHPGTTQAIYSAIRNKSFNSHICGENLVLIKNTLPWSLKKVFGFTRNI